MRKQIFALFMIGLLGGCLGGYSPQSRFYNLQPADAAGITVVSPRKISMGINEVELPDYLDRPQMVSFDQGKPQMNIAETDRWGEPLASMIQRTMAADLALYLPQAVVKPRSSLMEKFNFIVDVQIIRFDMIRENEAVLEAWWYISNADGHIVYRHKTALTQKIGSGFDSFVKAESQMLTQMSREIAQAAIKL